MALSQRLRWGLVIALPTVWAFGSIGYGLWQLVRPLTRVSSRAAIGQVDPVESTEVSGLFNYGGSTAWAPLRPQLEAALAEVHPGFELRYVQPAIAPPGSRVGVRMLIEDDLTFAQTSHPLGAEDYDLARASEVQLSEIRVAIDGIAVVVHPDLDIEGLTIAQMRDIYSGRVRNWQQVGGPDRKIVPFSRPTSVGGTVSFFVEDILGDRPLSTHVRLVPTTTQALQNLRDEPGGIYYASAPVVVPQCGVKAIPIGREGSQWVHPAQQPPVAPETCPTQRDRLDLAAIRSGEYPLTRNLYLVIGDRTVEAERAGKTFAEFILSDRGQHLVTEAGFVAIR
ncbi:MAG: substrate-binding domain-containing protein [Cyanobacteria bacterium J06639_1]